MLDYDSPPFDNHISRNATAQQIWATLVSNVTKMEDVSWMGLPAVQGVDRVLLSQYGPTLGFSANEYRHGKQMVGRMIRQIMEANGWNWREHHHPVQQGQLFKVGSVYIRSTNEEVSKDNTRPKAEKTDDNS